MSNVHTLYIHVIYMYIQVHVHGIDMYIHVYTSWRKRPVTGLGRRLLRRSGCSAELRLAGVTRVISLMGHEVSLWTKYIPVRRASVHCIYVYVLVYTMLGWKLWFWKGFNALNNSLYWSDAYSNDPTIFNGWMLSNQCWVLDSEDVQTCLYHLYKYM